MTTRPVAGQRSGFLCGPLYVFFALVSFFFFPSQGVREEVWQPNACPRETRTEVEHQTPSATQRIRACVPRHNTTHPFPQQQTESSQSHQIKAGEAAEQSKQRRATTAGHTASGKPSSWLHTPFPFALNEHAGANRASDGDSKSGREIQRRQTHREKERRRDSKVNGQTESCSEPGPNHPTTHAHIRD